VNAIDQDLLGKQADRTLKEGDIEVWSRPLADGAFAVGIFNTGDTDKHVDMKELLNSSIRIQNSKSKEQEDSGNAQCSMLNAQCSMLNAQCSMFNAQCSMFNAQCSMLNAQCSMFNAQCSMIRDLWRQKNLSEDELKCTIPLHGCRYLKVWF
jgi:hypothetical protein